jgi:predicted flap endonuclease-1-like 5' DNA nuclease
MPIEDLVEFINKTGKGHFENPDEVAAAVQKAARSSYRLPKTVTDSVNQVLAVSFAAIDEPTRNSSKSLIKQLRSGFSLIPNTLTSIKGIGPVYAAGIVAEIGDIHRFKDHAAKAQVCGHCLDQTSVRQLYGCTHTFN